MVIFFTLICLRIIEYFFEVHYPDFIVCASYAKVRGLLVSFIKESLTKDFCADKASIVVFESVLVNDLKSDLV